MDKLPASKTFLPTYIGLYRQQIRPTFRIVPDGRTPRSVAHLRRDMKSAPAPFETLHGRADLFGHPNRQ
jgi:hypothetical protein